MAKTSKNQKTSATANNSQTKAVLVDTKPIIEDSLASIETKIRNALNSMRKSTLDVAFYVNEVKTRELCDGNPQQWALIEFDIDKSQYFDYCRVASKFLRKNAETGEIENTISEFATFTQLKYLSHKELTEKDIERARCLINKGVSQKLFESSMNSQLGIEDKSKNSDNSKKKTDNSENEQSAPISSQDLMKTSENSDSFVEFFKVFTKHVRDFNAFLNTDPNGESYQKIMAMTTELRDIQTSCSEIADKLFDILK